MKTTTTNAAFHKDEIRTGKKLVSEIEQTLIRLNELGNKIMNNKYLMRTGISIKCDFVSNTITNGKTKVLLKLSAIMPKD